MSHPADFGLPDMQVRRLSAIWLAFPLLLLGVWSVAAPHFHAVPHHPTTSAQAVIGGVAGRD